MFLCLEHNTFQDTLAGSSDLGFDISWGRRGSFCSTIASRRDGHPCYFHDLVGRGFLPTLARQGSLHSAHTSAAAAHFGQAQGHTSVFSPYTNMKTPNSEPLEYASTPSVPLSYCRVHLLSLCSDSSFLYLSLF